MPFMILQLMKMSTLILFLTAHHSVLCNFFHALLIAFALCCIAYSLHMWRRNGAACDKLLFSPGAMHAQRFFKTIVVAILQLQQQLQLIILMQMQQPISIHYY